MLKGKTNIGIVGTSTYILVPAKVLNDSAFPFKIGEELDFEIGEDKILIMKPTDEK